MNCPRCKSEILKKEINPRSVFGIEVFECLNCLSGIDLGHPRLIRGYRKAIYNNKVLWESITVEGYRVLYRYFHPDEVKATLAYPEGQTELTLFPQEKHVGTFPLFSVGLDDTETLQKTIKIVLAFQ